jgi:hypothetical protein
VIWNAPIALAGLLLLAGPLLVHLLVRQHATRVVFPAMRFVPGVRAAAVRLRRPSDLGLLAIRMAAVTAAVLAAAAPVLITSSRQQAWASRLTRAIVIDTSASVAPGVARELASHEAAGVFASRRFETSDLRDGIERAAAWLSSASGRREIVVISDFQAAAVEVGDLSRVPVEIGLRPVRAGMPSPPSGPLPVVEGWRGGRWSPAITVDATGTAVTWQRQPDTQAAAITVLAPDADLPAARRALAAAQASGLVADASRRVEISFAGAAPSPAVVPRARWIAVAAVALSQHPLIAATGAAATAGERDGVMAVTTNVAATAAAAPAVIRAVIEAATPPAVDAEREPRALDEAALAAWRRDPVTPPASVPPDASDGRWLWAVALACLGIESVWRRRRASAAQAEVHADAA